MTKFDSTANVVWSKLYSIYNVETVSTEPIAVINTSDSAYIFACGYFTPSPNYTRGIILGKIDANGNSLWVKAYKNQSLNTFRKMVYHPAEYVFIMEEGGTLFQPGLQILKFSSSNGQFLSEKTFYDPAYPLEFYPTDIIVNNNLEIAAICSGKDSSYVFSFDTLLNVTMARVYTHSPSAGILDFVDLDQLSNDDYVISGSSGNTTSLRPLFLRLDSTGSVLAQKIYHVQDIFGLFCRSSRILHFLNNQILLVTGTTDQWNGPTTLQIIKTDANGDTLATHNFRGKMPQDLTLSTDGNPVFLTEAQGYSYGFYYKYILLKTSNDGEFPCNELPVSFQLSSDMISSAAIIPATSQTVISSTIVSIADSSLSDPSTLDYCLFTNVNEWNNVEIANLKVFPNPASDHLYLELSGEILSSQPEITLYDSWGRRIFIPTSLNNPILDILVKNLDSGIYLLTITDQHGIAYFKKIVINH